MASRETYTFALLKSLYDDNQDLLSTLRPFFLGVLSPEVVKSARDVKAALQDVQAMDIPIHVIQKCGEAAEARGLVKMHRSSGGEREYILTATGADAVVDVETLSDVKRRVKHADAFLVECMKARGIEVESSEVDLTLRRLISRNLETVVGFVVSGGEKESLDVKTESAIESALAECVAAAAQGEPAVYTTLRDLVYGSVVLATLSSGDDRLIETVKSPLAGIVAYADTNWILGVLELDTPARNLAAAELVRLAQRSGIEVRMLDFVMRETQALLKHYEDEYDTGGLPIDPASVFTQMKLQGKKPSDILLLRTYLEDTLAGHAISVEHTRTDPRRYKPADLSLIDVLMNLKHEETPRRTLVDLAAIGHVQELRGRQVPDLESSGYVMLTCDATLSRFNATRMGHAVEGSYPEVVLDKTLTTVLWLKNPGLDIPLEAVVAAHSRGLLHRQAVWFQVVTELARAAASGTVTKQDISIFLSSDGPDLIADSVARLEEVTPEIVRNMVGQARIAHDIEIDAVKAAFAAEGTRAVGAVKEMAEASIQSVQREAEQSLSEAGGKVVTLGGRVKVLESIQGQARTELLERNHTTALAWAVAVPVIVASLVAGGMVFFHAALESWLTADVFRFVAVPLVGVVTAVACGVLGMLTRRVALRRGEKRVEALFQARD